MQPRPSKIAWLAVAGLLLAYLAVGYWLDGHRVPRYYQEFHATRLRGIIRWQAAGKLTVSLRLRQDKRTYHFFPRDGRGYSQAYEFAQLAQPGDSVYKAGGSDTLYLRAKGRTYFFIGEKPR